MSAAGDEVLHRAAQLVQHCERSSLLLRSVLDCADTGLYDPVDDGHAVRIPGGLLRAIAQALPPTAEHPPT